MLPELGVRVIVNGVDEMSVPNFIPGLASKLKGRRSFVLTESSEENGDCVVGRKLGVNEEEASTEEIGLL